MRRESTVYFCAVYFRVHYFMEHLFISLQKNIRRALSTKGASAFAAGLLFFQSTPSPTFSVRQPVVELPAHIQELMQGTKPRNVIIMYKDAVTEADVASLKQAGSIITHKTTLVPAIMGVLQPSEIGKLARSGRIADIVADYEVNLFLDQTIPQIGANTMHNLGATGVGAKVCIVDTGVDDTHPALPHLLLEHDFANNDNDATDDNQHGTHVAGIIASHDPVFMGVAPGVSLMAAKVLNSRGSGSASEVMAGIEWCVQNDADIINLSLGGGSSATACDNDPLAQAANAAVDAGVVVFAASGNSGRANRIASPACGSKVISVGAVDKSDVVASYSNGGSELDVTAPGSSVKSTIPGGGFAFLSGTSMASPHAAAVGAIIRSILPNSTPAQVQIMMRESAHDLGPAGFDFAYGYGRIDALAAYQYALNGPPPPPPPPPPSEDIFTDDFENGLAAKWTITNQQRWVTRAPIATVPGAPSGNDVAHGDGCNVAGGCILTSIPPLNLSAYEGAELSFWRYVDSGLDAGEYLQVQVFDGFLWNTIYNWTNGAGDDSTWHKETFDLSSKYLEDGVEIRFVTSESSSIERVEIDDVLVKGYLAETTAPTAHAGNDQSVHDSDGNGTQSVTLDGSASTDNESIVSYEWKENSTVLGSTAVLSHAFPVGTHLVSLTVTDNDTEQSTDTVQIVVTANTPPVANAGPNQTLSDGDGNGFVAVTLTGAASTDAGGTIVSYLWKEGVAVLGTGSVLGLNLPVGTHTIDLTVTDNGGLTSTDSVVITLQPNAAPVARAGADQTKGDADNTGSESITLDGTASTDDNVIVSHVWKEGSTHLGTGATIPAVLPIGVHTISLTVTDDTGQQGTDTVVITITANAAPVAHAGADQTVTDTDANGTESLTVNGSSSTDTDGTIVSYEWKEGATVLGTNASLTQLFALGSHTLTLTVTDNGGLTSTDTVVLMVNAAPPTPIQAFSDTFTANGLPQWTTVGTGWQRKAQNITSVVPGHPSGNSLAHGENCSTACTLTTLNTINLTGYQNAVLSFWRFVDRSLDAGEYLRVEVYNGTVWTTLATWTDGQGDDNTWQFVSYDVTPYLNANFRIRFVTQESSSLEEVEIDDVLVQGFAL